MNLRKLTADGARAIQHYECCVLRLYLDVVRKWTIAWGHLCSAQELASGMFANGITQLEADALFWRDISPREVTCSRLVDGVEVEPHEYDVLMSFGYNEGFGNLAGSTLLQLVRAGRKSEVPEELKKWDKVQDPDTHQLVHNAGLLKRRIAEGLTWVHGYGHPDVEAAIREAALSAYALQFTELDLLPDLLKVTLRDE